MSNTSSFSKPIVLSYPLGVLYTPTKYFFEKSLSDRHWAKFVPKKFSLWNNKFWKYFLQSRFLRKCTVSFRKTFFIWRGGHCSWSPPKEFPRLRHRKFYLMCTVSTEYKIPNLDRSQSAATQQLAHCKSRAHNPSLHRTVGGEQRSCGSCSLAGVQALTGTEIRRLLLSVCSQGAT